MLPTKAMNRQMLLSRCHFPLMLSMFLVVHTSVPHPRITGVCSGPGTNRWKQLLTFAGFCGARCCGGWTRQHGNYVVGTSEYSVCMCSVQFKLDHQVRSKKKTLKLGFLYAPSPPAPTIFCVTLSPTTILVVSNLLCHFRSMICDELQAFCLATC